MLVNKDNITYNEAHMSHISSAGRSDQVSAASHKLIFSLLYCFKSDTMIKTLGFSKIVISLYFLKLQTSKKVS